MRHRSVNDDALALRFSIRGLKWSRGADAHAGRLGEAVVDRSDRTTVRFREVYGASFVATIPIGTSNGPLIDAIGAPPAG